MGLQNGDCNGDGVSPTGWAQGDASPIATGILRCLRATLEIEARLESNSGADIVGQR